MGYCFHLIMAPVHLPSTEAAPRQMHSSQMRCFWPFFTSQPGPQMNLLCVKLSFQNKGAGKRLLLSEGRCFFPVWIESIIARREEVRYMSHLAHLQSALETLILLTHP